MSAGPFILGAPWALLALLALPLIWWLLKATPPAPHEAELPSLQLLDGIADTERQPDRTPWWILLLRLLAVVLAVIGLSQPAFDPEQEGLFGAEGGIGPFLLVIDDGWQSAPRWADLQAAAEDGVGSVSRDTAVHLLETTPRSLPADPAQRLTRLEARQRVATMDPKPWSSDRAAALGRLEASGLEPGRIFYATNGLGGEEAERFAQDLAAIAPLAVYSAPPSAPFMLTGTRTEDGRAKVTAARLAGAGPAEAVVAALQDNGTALGSAPAVFEPGAADAEAVFDLPGAALARVSRFRLMGMEGPGAVWLWDATDRTRRVGIVSEGGAGAEAQPLLSDTHYVRKAIEPFAQIVEGDIQTVAAAAPDAILLTDTGVIPESDAAALSRWTRAGGALIRFAGPRLASGEDELVPVRLRRSARALGGSLAWEEPQGVAGFSDASPFAGLDVPRDAKVRRQILAEPSPDLSKRTWARLEDGSPLVTAAPLGEGTVVLFHVTAGPDWSDLPYSGTFVDMLKRAISAGRGERSAAEDETYQPVLVLDGFGRLRQPPGVAAPIGSDALAAATPSEINPPGFYEGPAGTRTLNAAAGEEAAPVRRWPAGVQLLGEAESRKVDLAAWFLGGAFALLLIDLLVALGVAGRLNAWRGRAGAKGASVAAAVLVATVFAGAVAGGPAEAQTFGYGGFGDPYGYDRRTADALEGLPPAERKAAEAALEMRFAYIETGDAALDRATRAGLSGLSMVLFRRTSVEPAAPHAVSLADPAEALELYPFLYYAVPDTPQPLSEEAAARLNAYLRSGGSLIIDTRQGGTVGAQSRRAQADRLAALLQGLDVPPLVPAPADHVVTKSFYLIDSFPGRFDSRLLWIEATAAGAGALDGAEAGAPSDTLRGDGVSRVFVGDGDWAAAWAQDERGRDLYSVDGGYDQRELARRFGINLVMYILTGNYKADQVHLPELLQRLAPEGESGGADGPTLGIGPPGGPRGLRD